MVVHPVLSSSPTNGLILTTTRTLSEADPGAEEAPAVADGRGTETEEEEEDDDDDDEEEEDEEGTMNVLFLGPAECNIPCGVLISCGGDRTGRRGEGEDGKEDGCVSLFSRLSLVPQRTRRQHKHNNQRPPPSFFPPKSRKKGGKKKHNQDVDPFLPLLLHQTSLTSTPHGR